METPSRSFKVEETRQEIVHNFLDNLGDLDKAYANDIASQIASDRPLAETVVIIPVAAHQEAAQIPTAIAQYARQLPVKPFSVVLGLNCADGYSDSSATAATRQAVQDAQNRYPDLDIRSSFVTYARPRIGAIRRDLWNGVIEASRRTGNFDSGREIVGINHDIDMLRLARAAIAKIQTRYEAIDRLQAKATISLPLGTKFKHAFSLEHPNISKAVAWQDFYIREAGFIYEAGVVFPISFYAHYGGIKREAFSGESLKLMRAGYCYKPSVLKGTNTETSIRRFVHSMDQFGYDIWLPGMFRAEDECRDDLDTPDIPTARMHAIVESSLDSAAENLINNAHDEAQKNFWDPRHNLYRQGMSGKEMLNCLKQQSLLAAQKSRRLSEFMLERMVGAPHLAALFAKNMSDEHIAAEVDKSLFLYAEVIEESA
jgi:hypothetical protein